MGKVSIEEVKDYGGFGKCIRMCNGSIELYVTTDIGPRIIRFGFLNKPNMFYEDNERMLHEGGEAFNVFGENNGWYSYGGHRLWISPEAFPRTYYPDNEKVAYEIVSDNKVILNPKKQVFNQHTLSLSITMNEDNEVILEHSVTNSSGWDVELALWPITVLSKNGLEVMSQPDRPTGLLSNRIFAVWPYAKMNDERVYFGDKFITLTQNPNADCPFKIGFNNEKNYAAYFNFDCLFIKTHNSKVCGVYPDGGMSFETYTNPHFLEMETLGELVKLKPGESTSHTEGWKLFENVNKPNARNEEEIEKVIKQYI